MCAQRRLRSAWASAQSDQSSLCTQWVAKDPSFLHTDSEDWPDWADAQADLSLHWAHTHFVGFIWGGSFIFINLIFISFRHQLNPYSLQEAFFFGLGFTAYQDYFVHFEQSLIVRWGEKRRFPRKTPDHRKQNLACLTCDPSWARTHSGEMMSGLERLRLATLTTRPMGPTTFEACFVSLSCWS